MGVSAGKNFTRFISKGKLMDYVKVPSALSNNDILAEDACFSPGRYVRFIPPELKGYSHYVPLNKLVHIRDEVTKASKHNDYRYVEIGDINVATGGISFQDLKGYQLPTKRPSIAKQGDILISTVRTYRKGIGLVMDDSENLVTTNAVLNFCAVTDFSDGITLPYIYSFLRSDFFVEQVWSLLNRGVYPRMDTGALEKIIIPVADCNNTCAYVDVITKSIAEKEKTIRDRNDKIQSAINYELILNQSGLFCYEYPNSDEISELGRFDAAIYGYEYKSKISLIKNYCRGYITPSNAGFTITPGPSLEIKLLKTRLDSEKQKPGFYQLFIPTNISEYGTMGKITWLGTAKKLPLLRAGDILFGEAGFQKGRSIVLVDAPDMATTNAHGLYSRRNDGDLSYSIYFRCIFNWYRSQRLIDLMAVGGSGGHFSPNYFDFVLIPKFPDAIKEEIVRLYHNDSSKPSYEITLENFVEWHREWNKSLGIWELDKEMKILQQTLNDVQEKIIEGKKVNLPF